MPGIVKKKISLENTFIYSYHISCYRGDHTIVKVKYCGPFLNVGHCEGVYNINRAEDLKRSFKSIFLNHKPDFVDLIEDIKNEIVIQYK
jgi:hypothetical protein